MDVEVIHDRDRLGPLQEEWDRLNLKAADASLFSSFDWIMAWTKSGSSWCVTGVGLWRWPPAI